MLSACYKYVINSLRDLHMAKLKLAWSITLRQLVSTNKIKAIVCSSVIRPRKPDSKRIFNQRGDDTAERTRPPKMAQQLLVAAMLLAVTALGILPKGMEH